MSDPTGVFVDEGLAFIERHKDEAFPEAHLSTAGFVWGLMRAYAACPDCPGAIRNPVGERSGSLDAFDVLVCPACGKAWASDAGLAAIRRLQGG